MRFNTLAEWLAWLERLHPFSIEMGLDRVGAVWKRLAVEPLPFITITVGGTNGKGSCVAMLEAIYRGAGYRTGAYTSPHLIRFNERIRLNGTEIDDERLCRALDAVDRARDEITLTYFEFTTLAALHLFLEYVPDVVILEVGLGGRLDAVNIVDPDVSLITTIALDHQTWLGDELGQIAREKAGIMRRGRITVFAGDRPSQELFDVAKERGATLLARDRDYSLQQDGETWIWQMDDMVRAALPLPALRGGYQLYNAAAVLAVIQSLAESLPVSNNDIRRGLVEAQISGRFQVIPGDIVQVFDVAHNPEAAAGFADTLADVHCSGKIYAVFGILDDKNLAGVVAPLIGYVDIWCLSAPKNERALPVDTLVAYMRGKGLEAVQGFETLENAYEYATKHAVGGDMIVVFGSFYTVSEVMPLISVE